MLDLLVVGAGLAGCFAAYTAARAGLRTAIIARGMGSLHFGAGTIDVLGYEPAGGNPITHPLEALERLAQYCPEHPYALLSPGQLAQAIDEFELIARELGIPYGRARGDGENLWLPTAVGAARPTWLAPEAQLAGDLSRTEPMVIAGFTGLRDFFPQLIAENLTRQGYQARAVSLPVDLLTDRRDYSTVHLALELERPDRRVRLGLELARVVRPGERIGMPALLGLEQHQTVWRELSSAVGAPLFEIPMLPPSIPGMRLGDALVRRLRGMGVSVEVNTSVSGFSAERGVVRWLESETSGRPRRHAADRFLLATGGTLSGGIEVDLRGEVRETVCNLPTKFPASRDEWFSSRFLDPAGHPIFTAGIRVDRRFRPIGNDGAPAYQNVYAAGGLLANADPVRERSLEGIAVATGRAAAISAAQD